MLALTLEDGKMLGSGGVEMGGKRWRESEETFTQTTEIRCKLIKSLTRANEP